VAGNQKSMYFWPISEEEIVTEVSKLKGKTTAGCDEIPDFLVKACITGIKKLLNFIFNESINQAVFPDLLKVAKIRPVYKRENKQEVGNYRPIWVLSIFSKILEKIVYNRFVSFTTKFKILTETQYGFQKNKSTILACQSFVGKIQEALGKLLPVGIFFDLTKAYYVIDHEILLGKLELYGIRGQINVWLKSYLTSWAQFVEVILEDNKNSMTQFNSRLRNVKVGIPRGSTLGLLLFLIYINDLPLHIKNGEVILFADDTTILVIDKNKSILQDKVDKVMKQLESWFSMNTMVINCEKTKAMFFQLDKLHDSIEPVITFKNLKINYASEFRFLGINVTHKLKWNVHIQSVCAKLIKVCYIIKALKNEGSLYILRNVYFAKVQSLISYGLIFWGEKVQVEKF
jgi:uncharacterized protein YlzI (FlbEa/FlbD family)